MTDTIADRQSLIASMRARMDLTTLLAISALAISALSFYRSYLYTNQQLDVTVTDVSYVTNQGALYMTVAFANGGNRDAALLRVEPALWGRRGAAEPEWIPLTGQIAPGLAVTEPKMPTVVDDGGVELVTLSVTLDPADAERAVTSQGGAYVGIRVATMNSDGNLFFVQHPVARLVIDKEGRIRGAEPTIHRSLSGFTDLAGAPPGDTLQANKKTPFVWADDQLWQAH
jgi:hypothetical protein